MIRLHRLLAALTFVATAPFTMGAEGGCGGTFGSKDPAPVVSGKWGIAYSPNLEVKVNIGGSAYVQTLTPTGGSFTVMHGGKPYPFTIDCSKPEVVCPSEVWATQVSIDQRDATYQHRMWVSIPVQQCSGTTSAPAPGTCGTGTLNPDCKPVCNGTITTANADAFGLIRDGGTGFDLLLGAGIATNGVNCALLGISVAQSSLITTGLMGTTNWRATAMPDGQVKTGYAGGCVWAGSVGPDGKPDALVLGASLEMSTKFSGTRIE